MASTPPVIPRAQALRTIWDSGRLHLLTGDLALLDANQVSMYQAIEANGSKGSVLLTGRRVGKTWTLCYWMLAHCLATPGFQVKFLAKTQKSVRAIITPTFRKLMQRGQCPVDLRPEWSQADGTWTFSNGSVITVAGSDTEDGPERLRGQAADAVVVDEAGFVRGELDYILEDILAPQLIESEGPLILCSSPPRSPTHPFVALYRAAQAQGTAIHRTIMDAAYLDAGKRDRFIAQAAARKGLTVEQYRLTPGYLREWEARLVKDENSSAVPEANEQSLAAAQVLPAIPPYRDCYVGLDEGFARDLTVCLFGYWDFRRQALVIQREVVARNTTTDALAAQIKQTELALWDGARPLKRTADQHARLIGDLARIHGIHFAAAEKGPGHKERGRAEVRYLLATGSLYIDPSCQLLLATLLGGQMKGDDWGRSEQLGHLDALDALIILALSVSKSRNPYPVDYGLGRDRVRLTAPARRTPGLEALEAELE